MASTPRDRLLDELLAVAVKAADAAVQVHRAGFGSALTVEIKSSDSDLVSDIDRGAERRIVELIADARPDDGLLGEEGAHAPGTSGVRWVIDPLDGTANYVHGHPAFACSIGVEVEGQPVVGVVHETVPGIVYTGIAGRGARRDGEPIHVTAAPAPSDALVATGFAYDPERRGRQARALAQVLPRIRDIRRGGSAALDLCAVASGQVDAYFELGLGAWDLSAGGVIARAAGAEVMTLPAADPADAGLELILAANPSLAPALRTLLFESGAIQAG
jgi:myo-inositol-1(or 4)-monophosphatase